MLLASTLLPATVTWDQPVCLNQLPICCLLHVCHHGSCPSVSVVQVEDHGSTPSVGGGAHCTGSHQNASMVLTTVITCYWKNRTQGLPCALPVQSERSRSDQQRGRGRCSPSPDYHPGPCQDNGNMDYACMSPHMVLSEGQSPHLAFRR